MNKERLESEILEMSPNMTEAETLVFLKENGVKQLPLEDYKTGQTVLYVMEQSTQGDNGPFRKLPPNQRPSIARLSSPGELDLQNPIYPDPEDRDQTRIVYDLHNPGNRVDYFAINRDTKQPTLVRTSYTKTDMNARPPVFPYKIRPKNLFHSADLLFPEGK